MEALEYWQYRGYPGYCQFYLDGSGFEIKDRKTWRNIAAGQLEPYELYRDWDEGHRTSYREDRVQLVGSHDSSRDILYRGVWER